MIYETMLIELDGPLATLKFNRPDRMNAMNTAMAQEMPEAMTSLIDDENVRAILITGEGKGFCAGADLQAMHEGQSGKGPPLEGGANLRRYVNPVLLKMARAPKPIIAAVNGPAAGVGCGIALGSDIVLAGRSAAFIQAFSRIGAVPDGGSSWVLPRLVGYARATAMMMTGEPVSAEDAAQWGMIHQVLDDDALMPAARKLAMRMANGPTKAYATTKEMLVASAGNAFDTQLALESECQDIAFGTQDFLEGVSAFVEKRPARFSGR